MWPDRTLGRRMTSALGLAGAALAGGLGLAAALPAVERLERSVGLSWHYTLRGHEPVPPGAAIVAIDDASVAWLQRMSRQLSTAAPGLDACLSPAAKTALAHTRGIEEVPREVYACLISALDRAGARLIVIDINFSISRPEDAIFAQAIRTAGRVLLLERVAIRTGADKAPAATLRRRPAALLRDAALGTVGFHVESAPGERTIRYLSRFEDFPDLPALPVEVHRQITGRTPRLSDREPIRFYGPALSVPTRNLRAVFEPGGRGTGGLSGRVVFVGTSEHRTSNARDAFLVPIEGETIFGVELAATAYLNLLHGDRLSPLEAGTRAAVSFAFAGAAVLVVLAIPSAWALAALGGLGLVWTGVSALLFTSGIWMPLAWPILVCLPGAALFWISGRLRLVERLARALLPEEVVGDVLEGGGGPGTGMTTVMFVDIASSTEILERIGADGFADLLNRYYALVGGAVRATGGSTYENRGDGMIALFSERALGADHAAAACRAAVEVGTGLCHPDGETGLEEIRLRIGIATGPTMVGAIRFGPRLSISAVGNAVYTAARLQELGKGVTPGGPPPRIVAFVDQETVARAKLSEPAIAPYGQVLLRGRSGASVIYRLSVDRRGPGLCRL
ncbi:MAG: CHASE2 domain-containing protein [Paracoccaceae bacterium]